MSMATYLHWRENFVVWNMKSRDFILLLDGMRKLVRKYLIVGLFMMIFGSGFVMAESWNLPWVDIVTRAEWGADETLKYASRDEYQQIIQLAEEREKYMSELDHEKADEASQNSATARAYALEHFPNDILLDMVVDTENGHKLWRKKEYVFNKTKIIVHHTVNDMSKLQSESNVKALLRSVYSMHALQNGWGDIGYNFVISPGGIIYEGRSGGEGIVGAHATWNNQPSVGIALIGNFEVDKPTDAQINALIRLSAALAAKYKIDPMVQVEYHKKSSVSPYVTSFNNFALAGHRDVWATACPGENLYKLLPAIRDRVVLSTKTYLLAHPDVKPITKPVISSNTTTSTTTTTSALLQTLPTSTTVVNNITKLQLTVPAALGLTKSTYLIRTRVPEMGTTLPECKLVSGQITIVGCMYRSWELVVGVKKNGGIDDPGIIRVSAKSRRVEVLFDMNISRQGKYSVAPPLPVANVSTSSSSQVVVDSPELQQRKTAFPISTPNAITKVIQPVSASQIPALIKQDVSVLLYNASMQSSSRMFVCSGKCSLSGSPFTTVSVSFDDGMLRIQKNGLTRKESQLKLQTDTDSTIAVLDGLTKKQYGIYRWAISLLSQNIKKVDGKYVRQYGIINTLPVEQYLDGMAEASDREPLEKTKVLALLTKAYALYYIAGSGPHPSIPQDAAYQAIDDPRFFQKYVGVTWEKTSKNWPIAVAETKNKYIVYNNTLPILPYFHCSPGFTRSAREKWGWSDTPYLKSVLDDSGCSTFEGHGVGLSGQWATKKAMNGEKAEAILKYYYDGIDIVSIP